MVLSKLPFKIKTSQPPPMIVPITISIKDVTTTIYLYPNQIDDAMKDVNKAESINDLITLQNKYSTTTIVE